jgi:hypothetical protein
MVKNFFFFWFDLSINIYFSLELTCGIHVRFQIRDVPGPKAALSNDFETYASESTTIIFILDVTVRCIFFVEIKI